MRLILRNLGVLDYASCFDAMQRATAQRQVDTADEIWTLQHPSVFTLGRAGKREHILAAGNIPVIEFDRGGQLTYHGLGQLVVYTLLDVRRMGIGPRELVRRLEQGIIDYLATLAINAERRQGAPGVYVSGDKVAALGLRIKNRYSYHGIALNVAMDLEPYQRITPCGYAGLGVTDLYALCGLNNVEVVREALMTHLLASLYERQSLDVELHPQLDESLNTVESVSKTEATL